MVEARDRCVESADAERWQFSSAPLSSTETGGLSGRIVASGRVQVIGTLRQARREYIPAMHRVRLSVQENRLASVVTEEDYIPAIEETGRGA